ncbi:MAG: PAS domain-containing protein [Puniceicoccales bacterium]|jgi:signal transduction histidine kinase|nr:PAS domain-containing protein [Puniceicoccales bacterium]
MKENKFKKLFEKLNALDARELHLLIRRLYHEQEVCHRVFDLLNDGVLILTNSWTIEYSNNAAKEILGVTDQRQALEQYVPDLSFLKQIMAKCKKDIPFAIKELEIKYPHKKILSMSGMRLATEHGGDFFILVIRDATATNDIIEQRVENERFSTINLLASGVAHELGNPLNAIWLRLQLMGKQINHITPSDKREQLQKSIDICGEEINRLDGIIKNFLQAIRPQKLFLRPTNIAAIVDHVLQVLSPELVNNGIAVHKNFSALPPILADEQQLKQAFFNIIKNSMEALPSHGNIFISSKLNATQLILEFADNGSGISEENMLKIASPYFSTKKQGNGLGLMIVERILREHGAILTIQSQPGLGTKIAVVFPIKDPSLPLFGSVEAK